MLKIVSKYIVRDFLHPVDFYQLISVILSAPAAKTALDFYSLAPIDRPCLLATMQERFGLQYAITLATAGVNARLFVIPCGICQRESIVVEPGGACGELGMPSCPQTHGAVVKQTRGILRWA